MNDADKSIAEQVFRLTSKFIFLEKKIMLRHKDLKLYPSEIHLLDVIDRHREINASDMAIRLGVTKGAVSQTLTRLVNKGVVYRIRDPQHKNELTVHFTELGKEVFEQHRKTRARLAKRFAEYLADVPDEERAVIKRFLKKLEGFFDSLN